MRNISFAKTTAQFLDGSKDVTRRLGWWSPDRGFTVKPGDRLCAVERAQGLKKGENVRRLGVIEVVSIRREPLGSIGWNDVRREGFPDHSPAWFVRFFMTTMKPSGYFQPSSDVTRIEFRRVAEEEAGV